MEKEYYGSGEASRKLGIPRRTLSDQARKGQIPGQKPYEQGAHRLYRSSVIDKLAEDNWPPIKASVRNGVLEIELRGLACEPFRIAPCPGELPEISAPEVHLPGGPTLSAWGFPRITNPFEVAERLRQHLWG